MRLAELLIAFSAVADLGMGLPLGEASRSAWVGVELARRTGCDERTVTAVFYAALLQHVGCTAYSHEVTALFADEISVKRASMATDFTRPSEIALGYLPRITREARPGERLRTMRSALLHSRSLTRGYQRANCDAAAVVAHRLGLPETVRSALLQNFEWWNGNGGPAGLRGDEISEVARIVNVAGYGVYFDRLGGPALAARAVTQRSGGYLDPGLASAFVQRAEHLLVPTTAGDLSDRLLGAEPVRVRVRPGSPTARPRCCAWWRRG